MTMYPMVAMPATQQFTDTISALRWNAVAGSIRFDRSASPRGTVMLLPAFADESNVRVNWRGASLVLLDRDHAEVSYVVNSRAEGLREGTAIVSPSSPIVRIDEHLQVTVQLRPYTSLRRLRQLLTRIEDDAKRSSWATVVGLEPFVKDTIHRIAESVADELGAGSGRLLDPIEVDCLVSEVLFGDGRITSKGFAIMERAAGDLDDTIGDIRKYVQKNLYSACGTAVRRAIGDPKIGTHLRRISRQLGTDDDTAVMDEYRRVTGKYIGPTRVRAAMTAAATVHSGALSLTALVEERAAWSA